jgi:hypothetical protein
LYVVGFDAYNETKIQRWRRRGQQEIEEGLRGGPEVLACPEIQLFEQLSFTSPD